MNLKFLPGPVELPPEVLAAAGRPMIDHRGPEFAELVRRVADRGQKVYQTKNDVLPLTGSGTTGMEASVLNFFYPGDKIVATSIGYFGDRWIEIAERRKAINVVCFVKPWGKDINPEELDGFLRRHSDAKGVLITHNETSTGVTNDLRELARVVRRHNMLVVVDAVSSMSAVPVLTDEWDLDIVVSATQKGFMSPPGLAMVSVSERAWRSYDSEKAGSYCLDLAMVKEFLTKGQTPSTPPLSVFFALDKALEMILQEGLQKVFLRHAKVAERLRRGVVSLGCSLFASPHCLSDAVTTVTMPKTLDAAVIKKLLREEHGFAIGGGMKEFSHKIIRLGHLGDVDEENADQVLAALKECIKKEPCL